MNIVVKTIGNKYIVRPDTTWEKDNEDFYPADFIEELYYTPVLFARICKPGKSIGLDFAKRYYDAINYGILLYPENLIADSQEDYACASCIDHTSFLPAPLYSPVTLGQDTNFFKLYCDNHCIFNTQSCNSDIIEQAIFEASKYIYLRIGDFISIELDKRKPLIKKTDGKRNIKASYCDNNTIDFNIIF